VILALALLSAARPAEAKYASIVIDAASGAVLHETNADTKNFPASLTKMMTLYLLFEAIDQGEVTLKTKLKVSAHAAKQQPSKLGLKSGTTITVESAIKALVTKSANDVAVVVAEKLGGTESGFAKLMNTKAKALGMDRTSFYNASGLPDSRQLSTARDMATLSLALIEDYPQYFGYFSLRSFTYKGKTYENHNKLLKSYAGVDGLKTGYTKASGFNISVTAVRDGRRLIAVVFGGKTSKSRNAHASDLLDLAFADAADLPPPAPPVQEVKSPPVAPPDKPAGVAGVATQPQSIIPQGSGQPAAAAPSGTLGIAPFLVASDSGATQVAALDGIVTDVATLQGPWGIQVGAFSRSNAAFDAATAASTRVNGVLATARVHVMEVQGDSGVLYRARLIDLSEDGAREACRQLTQHNVACLVVAPGS